MRIAVLTLRLRQEQRFLPAGLLLFSPWTDLTALGKSHQTKEGIDPVLSERYLCQMIENYLSEIYGLLLTTNPLSYFENQTILLADVFKENFQEAIMDRVETEVDNKMRNSIEALDHICNKENININRYEAILEDFEEIYYRRNAYVHTMGRANKDYMKKVNKKFLKDISEGDFLICDDIYIEKTIITLCKLMFSIAYELLVKVKANEENIEVVSRIFFDKLKQEQYALCKYAYYSLSQYKSLPFLDRTMYRMNYINAAKQLNENDLVQKELEKLDISIATDNFKIGKYCLADNHEQVYKMLQETYPKSFDAIAIREWPIFINFRETEFYSKFVSEHKEDFEIQCLVSEATLQTEETEEAIKETHSEISIEV